MKLAIKKGTTSKSIDVFIQDSSVTTGAGLTGLVFNTASLVAYYHRPGATPTAITLATQTVTGAYSSGGFVELSAANMPGMYRFDLPDALLATGVDEVTVMLKGATNMVPCALEIQLTNLDLNDAVRAGLTALPNAAAEAAGGLYTRGAGAGQINQPANGVIDGNVVRNAGTAIIAAGGRQEVNLSHWRGTALPAENTAGIPIVDTRRILRQGTAQAGAAGSITLDAGASATADFYAPCMVTIISGTGAGQGPRVGLSYNGTSKVLTTAPAWATNPDATSIFQLEGCAASLEAWLRVAPLALASQKVQADANLIQWKGVAPNDLASGRIETLLGACANDVITAAAIAVDAIGSSELAATAATEIADAIAAKVVESEGSYTLQQALSVILAVLAGRTADGGNTFKTPNNIATRAAATTNGSNERTAMTLTPSA